MENDGIELWALRTGRSERSRVAKAVYTDCELIEWIIGCAGAIRSSIQRSDGGLTAVYREVLLQVGSVVMVELQSYSGRADPILIT